MDEEENKILRKVLTLTEENNKMLKEMRSARRWASFFRLLYWLVIIAVAVAAYYFIQPYINQFSEIYGQAEALFEDASEVRDQFSPSEDGVE